MTTTGAGQVRAPSRAFRIPLSGSSIHVRERIRRMLEELIERAPSERHAVLKVRLDATAVQGEQL